jgi:hypothetical protein
MTAPNQMSKKFPGAVPELPVTDVDFALELPNRGDRKDDAEEIQRWLAGIESKDPL